MKKYISIIVFVSLFVIGCSEQSSINSPVNNVSTNEPNWISLPDINSENGISVMSMPVFQVSKEIDGSKGGKIQINKKCPGGPFGEVKVKATLDFPKDVFSGSKNITMTIDAQFGMATFSPHSNFYKYVTYNVELWGIDLSGVNPNNVNFVYQAEDGSYVYVEKLKIEVNINAGTLKVQNAKLPHFSRYGFVN